MIISATSTMALRCSHCGRLSFQPLTLFSFSRGDTRRIYCDCGLPLLSISTRDRRKFWLKVDCALCEAKHILQLSRQRLWSAKILEITCEDTGLEIGYIGPQEEVRQALQHHNRSLAEMAREIGCNDYFENPEVMYSVLQRVYELAENGELFCLCGNENIEMEIFPGHLELRCDTCKVKTSISAQIPEDAQKIQDTDQIIIPGSMTNLSRHKRGRRKGPSF